MASSIKDEYAGESKAGEGREEEKEETFVLFSMLNNEKVFPPFL